MEESKTTSDYVYEDEFSFVTKDNELFLKGRSRTEERKICSLDEEDIQSKIEDLKNAFAGLKQRVQEVADQQKVSSGQVSALDEEARTAKAIGDFDELFKTIEELEQRAGSSEEESE